MTTIRVLGPIDVVAGTALVPIPGRHERMLLGALAAAANRAVRFDELAEMIWGDEPPRSRDHALQTCVSRLRTVLGHDRITPEDHSYTLHATADDLDLLAFEALVSESALLRDDPAACLAVCKRAIDLWRGVPFGDFADEDPFRLEVLRLDELRLHAIETLVECELALGNEDLVIGTLEALVHQYPYREHIWHLLITALALADRRVEALRACQELRNVLGDVGLDLTEGLQELEGLIVTGRPDLLRTNAGTTSRT